MSTPEGAFADFIRLATANARAGDEGAARRMQEAAANLRAAMVALTAETVRAGDPKGYVEAVVDLRGRLQEMNISAYAMRDLDSYRLSDACNEAILVAMKAAGEMFAARQAELFGIQPGATSFEDAVPPGMRSWAEVDELRKAMP